MNDKKSRVTETRRHLVGPELRALAILLSRAAGNYISRFVGETRPLSKRENQIWPLRLPALRRAIITGANEGRPGRLREDVPHELVQDEYALISDAVDQVTAGLKGTRTPRAVEEYLRGFAHVQELTGSQSVKIVRGFPCPVFSLGQVVFAFTNPSMSNSERRLMVLALRLGLTERTARRLRSMKGRAKGDPPQHRSTCQRLLASLYLDAASRPDEFRPTILVHILEALAATDYSVYMLYYLAQTAHTVPPKLNLRPADQEAIERACEAATAIGRSF